MSNFLQRVLKQPVLAKVAGIFRAPQLQVSGFSAETWASPAVIEHQIQLASATVNVWQQCGTYEQDSSEPWLLMIHGFRGDHHGLASIAKGLVGYEVWVPDLPGFGTSPAMEAEHNVENYAAVLQELLESEPFAGKLLSNCIIVGHSFGSMVATKLATLVDVGALILINPIARLPLSAGNRLMTMLTSGYYSLSAKLPENIGYGLLQSPLIVRFMTEFMVVSDDEQMRAFAHDQHHKYFSGFANRKVLQEAYQASISSHCGLDAPAVDIPVLLIVGDQDPLASVNDQFQLQRRFSGSTSVRVFSPVGHLIHYEMPGKTAVEIRNFAREHLLDQS